MRKLPTAYSIDNLVQILEANEATDDRIPEEHVERLVETAEQRASARDANTLTDDDIDVLVATDWQSFAGDEFGYSGGKMNMYAIGTFVAQRSMNASAKFFKNVQVIQQDWLETGDGRKTATERYNDADFDGVSPGEMWIPDKALQYICTVELSSELLHGEATAADAM